MKRLCWGLILALLLMNGAVWAGTTGKVTGVIKDAKNGEPLPGVSVVIVGTKRGAVTDVSGTYYILSVDPGTYQLRATLVGYQAEIQKEVRVAADFTTTINYSLKESAVELGEISVVAEPRRWSPTRPRASTWPPPRRSSRSRSSGRPRAWRN